MLPRRGQTSEAGEAQVQLGMQGAGDTATGTGGVERNPKGESEGTEMDQQRFFVPAEQRAKIDGLRQQLLEGLRSGASTTAVSVKLMDELRACGLALDRGALVPFSWPSSDPAVRHITALDMETVDRRLGVRSAGSSSLAQRFTAPERDDDDDHREYDDSDEGLFSEGLFSEGLPDTEYEDW